MKITAINIRNGNVLEHQGKLWVVLKFQIIQPGKGASVIQVDMRDLDSGNKTSERWRTQETVEKVRLDEMEYQFLFAEDDQYHFMQTETFEQILLDGETIGEQKQFLKDGMVVSVLSHEGRPISVTLPAQVTLEIIEADPVVKGQTASSSYKPAMVEGDIRVMVPPHIEAGTRVVVNTEDGSYVERAKD